MDSSAPRFRWGIVATGKICNDFCCGLHYLKHYAAGDGVVAAPPSMDIVACAARSLDSSRRFAAKFGISAVNAYGSYAELFSNPDVNIVYVGAIHPMHKDLCVQALQAKKHVVCEKPMGMNLGEVELMQQTARENGCFLMEAMFTRFVPLVRKLRRLICEEEVIGDVKCIQADFGVPFPRDVGRIWDLAMGGGVLVDIGIYPLAAVPWIFGADKPLSCKVEGRLDDQGSGVDVFGTYSATYPGNRQAIVSWSALCQTPEETTVTGTKGYVKVHGPAHCPTKATLCLQTTGRGFEERVLEEALPDMSRCTIEQSGASYDLNFPNSEALVYEAVAAMEAIGAGRTECEEYPWAESRLVCELMDEIRGRLGVKYPQDQ